MVVRKRAGVAHRRDHRDGGVEGEAATASGSAERATPVPSDQHRTARQREALEQGAHPRRVGRRRRTQRGEPSRAASSAATRPRPLDVARQEQHRRAGPPDSAGGDRRCSRPRSSRPDRCRATSLVIARHSPMASTVRPMPERVLEAAPALEHRRHLPDQREHRHRLGVRLGDPDGEVHHPAARGGAADAERAMDARARSRP